MSIATLDWIVIGAYFVIITAIGLVVGYRVRRYRAGNSSRARSDSWRLASAFVRRGYRQPRRAHQRPRYWASQKTPTRRRDDVWPGTGN